MARIKKKNRQQDLSVDRFAGSSDEGESEDDLQKPEIEEENASSEGNNREVQGGADEDAIPDTYVTNEVSQDDTEPSEKMAGVMARILGNSAHSQSVVLAKTVTPLQRLQKQEKEKLKSLREKRQLNRERNLAALHIPLTVATTNVVGEGRNSVAQELEQERFHRRVATRGVVALFNAITQHQESGEEPAGSGKKSTGTKTSKHGFLDKIKTAAAKIGTKTESSGTEKRQVDSEAQAPVAKWDALKEDYMLGSKQNWDDESSDDAESLSETPKSKEDGGASKKRDKRRKLK